MYFFVAYAARKETSDMGTDSATDTNVTGHVMPEIRKINSSDIRDALHKGYDDFIEKPSFVFFLAIIYPVLCLFLARFIAGLEVLPYIWPLLAGGTMIAPIAVVGLYEVSRLLEQGQPVSLRNAFNLFGYKSARTIGLLSLVLGAIWVLWLASAYAIYGHFLGDYVPTSVTGFINKIFFTPEGQSLIMIGSAVGYVFALVIFWISVVSFPMIIDRDVTTSEAIATSLRVVLKNPITMTLWGLTIVVLMAIAAIPLLFGLAIVLPILGHATWHLYRRVVGE